MLDIEQYVLNLLMIRPIQGQRGSLEREAAEIT